MYDPYFCQGSIRTEYEKIGITHLIHEKRDFYADISAGKVPDYDILITVGSGVLHSGYWTEQFVSFLFGFCVHKSIRQKHILSTHTPCLCAQNPPYSQDHKERIIEFCAESGKAWCLLMPNYVANKSYFQDRASSMGSSRE